MGNMTDLVAAIRAAIDETERIAQAAGGTAWRRTNTYPDQAGVEDAETGEVVVYDEGWPTVAQADHIVRHDPERELRRCAADRKILDLHAPWSPDLNGSPRCQVCRGDGTYSGSGPCDTVVLVAEAYGVEP